MSRLSTVETAPTRATLTDGAATDGAVAAFDALYARHVESLTCHTFLLCGRLEPARRAVRRAFQRAWERWPEVASHPDPVGWVRAAACAHAMPPWRPAGNRHGSRSWARAAARAYPGRLLDRALFEALLSLPPCNRRALVLHDVVGLDLARTAAEMESSVGAAARRVTRAREELAAWVPRLAETHPERRGPVLRELLVRLAAAPEPARVPPAHRVREASERATRALTWAAVAFVALVLGVLLTAALRG
ncbi:sigma factor-like helix-turn-helix DNA-binding protein [Streptomyces sp. 4N509B]|uniref:sigma factor-like helix-turn-helix DNA-binding protein n=1 Tax=Streptomyces sp. 4N509B TaxID=3457413 RepID=UPI003FD4728F